MIRYRINQAERLLTLRYVGSVSVGEWRQTVARAIAECPEVVTFDSVNDTRAQDNFHALKDMEELRRAVRELGMQAHKRRAVTLARHKAHFGVARMFELLTEHERQVERMTTESIVEAAKWLGRPEELIRAELDAVDIAEAK